MSEAPRFSEEELERARRSPIISLIPEVKFARKGNQYWGKCPFHEGDNTPSFKVEGERYHCFGCQEDGDGISWLQKKRGLSFVEAVDYLLGGKFPSPKPNGKATGSEPVNGKSYGSLLPPPLPKHPQLGKPELTYEYFLSDGTQIGTICRWNFAKGKELRPATLVDGEWKWQGFPKPHTLYLLPEVISDPERPILIVEGEKSADAARELIGNMAVTTWPHGASAVDKADWKLLKGRSVVLWPDADEPGAKAMKDVGAALREAGAASVKLVKLPPGLPKGWDLADPLPEGLDPVALIEQARDIASERVSALGLCMASDIDAKDFKPPKWAIPDLVPEGLSLLAGKPKTGKSWMALDFAVSVAAGGYALGNIKCEPGEVLYLALEDTERRMQGRLRAVLQGQPAPEGLAIGFKWKKADEGGLEDLRAWLSVYRRTARLIIIDTLQMIRGERKRESGVYADDYRVVAELKTLADEFVVPIVLVHHQNKGTNDDPLLSVSGTAGITGSADTVLVLQREANTLNAELYVRGRDVNEENIAIQFDKETGRWTKLGKANDWRLTQERRAVTKLLMDGSAMSPKEIAMALGKRVNTATVLLFRMKKDGDISQGPDGRYKL